VRAVQPSEAAGCDAAMDGQCTSYRTGYWGRQLDSVTVSIESRRSRLNIRHIANDDDDACSVVKRIYSTKATGVISFDIRSLLLCATCALPKKVLYRRMVSSGMLRRVAVVKTDVSE
jgi:hypothetical protein